MKGIKVVHLSSVHAPFDVRIFHKECKSLARAGYDVTLIVRHDCDEQVDGVKLKAVPRPKGRLSRMTRTVWQVYREAVRQDADIYHFHDPELIPVGLLLRLKGKTVISDYHEDVPQDIAYKHYLPAWLRWPLGWVAEVFVNNTCRRFSAVVAATTGIGERFQQRGCQTVIIVHNYPILQELVPPPNVSWTSRASAVAYVGGVFRQRGIREIVEAIGLVPEGLRARLKVAGSIYPISLRQELVSFTGWARTDYLGVLNRPRVAELLAEVQAGLVLFHPEPNHIRAEPNKLFEYMSASIPVIASDFPLWREIIQKHGCGLVVNPQDPQAIARAIEHILSHPEEAEAMGRRGRHAVESQYNWTSEEAKLLELYGHQKGRKGCAA